MDNETVARLDGLEARVDEIERAYQSRVENLSRLLEADNRTIEGFRGILADKELREKALRETVEAQNREWEARLPAISEIGIVMESIRNGLISLRQRVDGIEREVDAFAEVFSSMHTIFRSITTCYERLDELEKRVFPT
jgi:chromosome segregation ATPase